MAQIIDFGKNVTASFSQSISLTMQTLPNSTVLGQFGVAVNTNGGVLLEVTVGLQSSGAATPDCLFTVVRNGVAIYTMRTPGILAGGFEEASFSFMDSGIAAGYYAYGLTVSAYSGGTAPLIVGPLVFSGLSMA